MYEGAASESELALFGFSPEDVSADAVEVWPEHWDAYQVFASIGTQWRVGPGGPVGLDYSVLPTVFTMKHIKRKKQPPVFECLRILEDEALIVMHQT